MLTNLRLAKGTHMMIITIVMCIILRANSQNAEDTDPSTISSNDSTFTKSNQYSDNNMYPGNISGVMLGKLLPNNGLSPNSSSLNSGVTDIVSHEYDVVTAGTLSTVPSSSVSSSFVSSLTSNAFSYFSKASSIQQKRQVNLLQHKNSGGPNLDVLIGVLVPFDGNRSFVVKKVAPALARAVEKVTTEMGPWNFKSITLLYADSRCDVAESMNQAIQLQERQKTMVFFGPVCDYAIAPVARQARFWNTLVITAGGTAIDYYWYKNTTYPTLTRVGPVNFQGYTEFMEDLAHRYHWGKFKVLYDSTGQDDNLMGFCHLIVEYLHHYLKGAESKLIMDYYKLDKGDFGDNERVLKRAVSVDYSVSSQDYHAALSSGLEWQWVASPDADRQ